MYRNFTVLFASTGLRKTEGEVVAGTENMIARRKVQGTEMKERKRAPQRFESLLTIYIIYYIYNLSESLFLNINTNITPYSVIIILI